MEKIALILGWIGKIKYLLVLVIFLVVIVALDENCLYKRYQRRVSIENYQQEVNKYHAQYEHETALLERIDSSHFAVEKIARERYGMQRPNEDVFIVLYE